MSRARRDRTSSEAPCLFFLFLSLSFSLFIHIISSPFICFFFFLRATNSSGIPYQSRRITKFDIDYNNNNTLTTCSASCIHLFLLHHSFNYNSRILSCGMYTVSRRFFFFILFTGVTHARTGTVHHVVSINISHLASPFSYSIYLYSILQPPLSTFFFSSLFILSLSLTLSSPLVFLIYN